MAGKKDTPKKRLIYKLKAKTILDVYKATGLIDLKEAHRRFYKNQAESSHNGSNVARDFDIYVMQEFEKLIRIDKEALKRIDNDTILKELMQDLNRLNMLLQSGDLTPDEVVKVTNAKNDKLKMLGMAKGTWDRGAKKPDDGMRDGYSVLEDLRKSGRLN